MENLKSLIPSILETYPNSHLLVIDDYSDDQTNMLVADYVRNFPDRLFYICRTSNPSYAESLLTGLKFGANKNYQKIVQMDADGSHSVLDIKKLIEIKASVVIGSRYKMGSRIVNVPIARQAISVFGNIYISFLWKTALRDKTNGFRAFDNDSLKIILDNQYRSDGFSIQIEILKNLIDARYIKIQETPITFQYREIGFSKFDTRKLFEAWKVATKLIFMKKTTIE